MSFISSLTQAITAYQEKANDRWARKIVSALDDENVQSIFTKVAEGKLVKGFSDRDSFLSNAQKSDVAVLRITEQHRIVIVFYVGGISDETLEVSNCSYDYRPSLLKIRDVVSPIFISNFSHWTLSKETLESDFAKCINHSKELDGPLNVELHKSASLLKQVVNGTHPYFEVISKADFDKRSYISATIYIDSFKVEKGDTLVVFGNGVGMDDWKQPIPMRKASSYPENCWDTTIRGKQETGEYKLALLKLDGTLELEQGKNRKFEDLKMDERGDYIHQLSPPVFGEWEVVRL